MSVGGHVIEVIDCGDKIWVNTAERRWTGEEWKYGERCAIYVERTPEAMQIRFRDSLWWQGREAYWTPRSGSHRPDTPIPRRGYSGVARPGLSDGRV